MSMDEERELAEFEQRLGRALTRVDAPEGFAERVMRRAVVSEVSPVRVMRQRWVAYAIAAMLLVSVGGGWGYRMHEQRRVEREFDTAMRVTGTALQKTTEQLRRAGVVLGD